MLILSRRVTKSIVIGNDIKVTIVSTNRRKGIVRIAIQAPGARANRSPQPSAS